MSERLLRRPLAPPPRTAPEGAVLLAAADRDADACADRLHDGALQALVVARYAADAAVRGADPVLVRDAVQEALVTLRHAVWALRPRGAADLPGALHDLSHSRATAGAPPLDLHLDAGVAAALEPAARALAYRFVQAGLPPGGPAAVSLGADGAWAVVRVSGRPDDEPGWTARAAALAGRLEVEDAATCLLLPLPEPDCDPEGDS